MPKTSYQALRQLATLYGMQTAYYDAMKRRQQATPEALLAVLSLLGAPIRSLDDVPVALRERRLHLWQRGLEPVIVAWSEAPAHVALSLPASRATGTFVCHVHDETGETHSWEGEVDQLPTLRTAEVEGYTYITKDLLLPESLPWGYHRLTVDVTGTHVETLLMVAPLRAYTPEPAARTWGVFLPLYAMQAQHDWGQGDFTGLEMLTTWVAEQGGGVVATLPLLSAFLDTPYEPSPYAPASRLFWNEFYIDINRVPGLSECAAAQRLLAATDVQAALTAARQAPLLDYRAQMALKRRVLEVLSRAFFTSQGEQYGAFQQYLSTHPAVEEYAAFRATGERQGGPWPNWPAPQRQGVLTSADYDVEVKDYHRYVQWLAHTQLSTAAAHGKQRGVRLYLDLPLGVHADGYDVWRYRDLFALEAAGGAPPDSVFTKGQNWGFPPLHPEAMRTQGYRYWRAYVRHQLHHTGMLRIDHVMGLHRLFWIPRGFEARHGVYVRYVAEELYAILCLESHRHQVTLVGENLGTVPTYVNTAMKRHRLHQMYVIQYELAPTASRSLRAVPEHAVASLNTHDMPPFAAYWQGLDITDLQAQGLLSDAPEQQARRQRLLHALQGFLHRQGWLTEPPPADVAAVLHACLKYFSASPVQVVLVNLEDLWLETQPQNFPGTHRERPNWQRKARYRLEDWHQQPQVMAVLHTLQHLRQQRRASQPAGS